MPYDTLWFDHRAPTACNHLDRSTASTHAWHEYPRWLDLRSTRNYQFVSRTALSQGSAYNRESPGALRPEHTFEAECREGHPRGTSPARIGEAPNALARVRRRDDNELVALEVQVKLRDGDGLVQAVVPRGADTTVARICRAFVQGHIGGPASYQEY